MKSSLRIEFPEIEQLGDRVIARFENGSAVFQSPNRKIDQSLNPLQRSLEKRDRNAQRDRGEDGEKKHVGPNRRERGFFQ